MSSKNIHTIDPEMEILLQSIERLVLDSEKLPHDAPRTDLDWGELRRLALHHRVEPILFDYLQEANINPPSGIREVFDDESELLTHRNVYMSAELIDLIGVVKANDIRVLTFKGPTLAELAYSDVMARRFGDLDLIVSEEDFSRTIDVLTNQGYTIGDELASYRQVILEDTDTDLQVDLHYSFTPERYPFRFPFDQLWEDRMSVSILGGSVDTPSRSDLIQIMAVHGTKHNWRLLEWLVSFSLLSRQSDLDWEEVLSEAEARGCHKMVLLGFQLSRKLFGHSPPTAISRAIDHDWLVRFMAEKVANGILAEGEEFGKAVTTLRNKYVVQLMLMNGLGAKFQYFIELTKFLLSLKVPNRV